MLTVTAMRVRATVLAALSPEDRAAVLAELSPEDRAAMSPEDRAAVLAAMSPEDRTAALAAMAPEDMAIALAAMAPEDRTATLAAMSPEERTATLAPMSPEDRTATLAPMSPEDSAAVLDSLDNRPFKLTKAVYWNGSKKQEYWTVQARSRAIGQVLTIRSFDDEIHGKSVGESVQVSGIFAARRAKTKMKIHPTSGEPIAIREVLYSKIIASPTWQEFNPSVPLDVDALVYLHAIPPLE